MLTSIAPKLPMRDKKATRDFYIGKLGFSESSKSDYPGYLMIRKDGIEIHFFEFTELNPRENYGQVYIRVSQIELGKGGGAPSDLWFAIADALGMPKDAKGLAVTDVDEASEAFTKGLRAGDVITEAGQQPVERLEDLETRLTEAKDAGRKSLLLLVRRAGDPRFVALSVEEQAPAEQ